MTTHDVFISYSHADNDALLEGQEGWISILQHALQTRLSQLLDREATVWWDRRRLEGNSYFDEVIADACQRSTTMLAVVTPRYLKSDYCRLELDHFANTRELHVGRKSRLFVSVKTPVDRTELPPALAGLLGYEFFYFPESSARFREYDVHEPTLRMLFMERLEDLAQSMSALIKECQNGESERSESGFIYHEPYKPKRRVLVATTSSDVKFVREGIVRELSAQGHFVLPEAPWAEHAQRFDNELLEAAHSAQLSVHILGAGYGAIPEDGEASYPALQYERVRTLAHERAAEAPLARILWIPRGVQATSDRQRGLLAQVRADESLGPLDELLEGSAEELKERILAKLAQLTELERNPHAHAQGSDEPDRRDITVPPSVPPNGFRKVYVISADNEELAQVTLVETHLGGEGFDVISSQEIAFEESAEPEREQLHQRWLDTCDGCLIFHGQTKLSWVRAQVDEVRKSLGRRRDPMRGHAVYVAPPIDDLKLRYQVQFPKLTGGLDPSQALSPFVELLGQGQRKSA